MQKCVLLKISIYMWTGLSVQYKTHTHIHTHNKYYTHLINRDSPIKWATLWSIINQTTLYSIIAARSVCRRSVCTRKKAKHITEHGIASHPEITSHFSHSEQQAEKLCCFHTIHGGINCKDKRGDFSAMWWQMTCIRMQQKSDGVRAQVAQSVWSVWNVV